MTDAPLYIKFFYRVIQPAFFCQLTGFSISTARAVTMMISMLTARILGERYDTLNALACAALLELFSHPEALFQASFLLSYGTILGIIFFIREWNDQNITENMIKQYLNRLILFTLAKIRNRIRPP